MTNGGCTDRFPCKNPMLRWVHSSSCREYTKATCPHDVKRQSMTGEGNTIYCRRCGKMLEDSK
jgi:hypothetical protein